MDAPKGLNRYEFRRMLKDVCLNLKEGIEFGFFELRVTGEVVKGKRKIQIKLAPIKQHMISEDEDNE